MKTQPQQLTPAPKQFSWQDLPRPFFVVAPMADVTDKVFRRLIAKYSRMQTANGGPKVLWTEFVSCDGLMHEEGKHTLLRDLEYYEEERPLVAQIFGANPETFYGTAKLVRELGFDAIDINTGCPAKNVNNQGAGAALIKTPELMKEILVATREGAGGLY